MTSTRYLDQRIIWLQGEKATSLNSSRGGKVLRRLRFLLPQMCKAILFVGWNYSQLKFLEYERHEAVNSALAKQVASCTSVRECKSGVRPCFRTREPPSTWEELLSHVFQLPNAYNPLYSQVRNFPCKVLIEWMWIKVVQQGGPAKFQWLCLSGIQQQVMWEMINLCCKQKIAAEVRR